MDLRILFVCTAVFLLFIAFKESGKRKDTDNNKVKNGNRLVRSKSFNDINKAAARKEYEDEYAYYDINGVKLANELCNEGNKYLEMEYFDLAKLCYSGAINVCPDKIDYYKHRALGALKEGNYDLAISDIDKMIRLKPNSFDGYHYKGLLYLKKKDLLNARKHFQQALIKDPSSACSNFRLEECNKKLKRGN